MTQAEIDDFRQWHEKRLTECGYPPKIANKLRDSRERWFPQPKESNP